MFAKVSAWLQPTPLAEKEQERVAKTLTILLVLVMIGAAILSVVRLISGERVATLYAGVALFVACTFLLILVRRGKYTLPSYATPILILLLFGYAISQDQGLHDIGLPALSLSIVLAAMMLGRRGAILLTILTIFSVIVLGVAEMTGALENALSATTGPDDILIVALSFGFIGLIVSIMVGNLSDSLREAREANRELQTLSATLENKVADRVKDLSLAASISATLSQEENLDNLLQNAANLIQQKFGLYYVQIYLLNKGANTLQLRAGSGSMGQELLRRGHRLLIGPGSINGVAAAERRSLLVANTGANPVFRSNTLLPLTRSEVAVPLLAADQLFGVLNLQSDEVEGLNENRLPAFEILANQLAIAIENAILLAETQAARAEMEAYARGVAQQGWEGYLNALDRPRFLGYRYDGREVRPLSHPLRQVNAEQNVARAPIEVVGQSIGAIQIEADEDHYWTEEDLDFIQSVAQKVGQQVEILRSLEEAAYYRQEAEGALRRLTQDAWREYQAALAGADGFVYDSVEVRPLTPQAIEESGFLLRQTLRVGDEVIGELALGKEGEYDPVEALEITAVVADQLSQHLENLRLSATTEKALGEAQQRSYQLAILNALVTKLSLAGGLRESMQIIVEQMADALDIRQARVALFNEQRNSLVIVAETHDPAISPSVLDMTLPVQGNPITEEVISSRQTVYVPDVHNSPLTAPILHILKEQNVYGLILMPILLNDEVVGTLGMDLLEEGISLDQDQMALAEAILRQASTAIEKARLFEQTQARAEELEAINQIAQIVARQSDRDRLLHTVYEQVGRIMPVDAYYVALYDAQNHLMEFPLIYDEGQVYREQPAPPSPNSRVYQVVRTGEPLLINRTPEEIAKLEAERLASSVGDPTRVSASLLFVPLQIGQEVVGVLSVQSYEQNAYDQRDVTLLAGIASHVAVALDNARLLAESSNRVQEGQILQSLASSINTAVDAESVLRTAAKEIGRALGLQTYVYLRDPAIDEDSPEALVVAGGDGRNGR